MPSQTDDGVDPPSSTQTDQLAGDPAPEPPAEATTAGYRPPRSPAYSAPAPPPVPTYARKAPVPAGPSTVTPPSADGSAQLGWYLLLVGVALVIAATAVTVVVALTGGDDHAYEFGEVGEVSDGVVVRPGEGDAEARPLEVGETVVAGWSVELPDDASTTLELIGGGTARLDSGARVAFVDDAVDPDTGERRRDSEPVMQVSAGRVWVNPGADAAAALHVEIPDGTVETTGNPVALDCTAACTIEAPAGGVTLTAGDGTAMAPAAGEIVTFNGPDAFGLTIGDVPSAWAQHNLDTDGEAGMPDPAPNDAPGIRGSAVLDGTYLLRLDVVGAPVGDAIPQALQYSAGETYTLGLTADGTDCAPASCRVPVSAPDGASGTAQVTEGTVGLTLGQPIDCYDESYTRVVVPEIGTTTVAATLEVTDVGYDGDRWLVRAFAGAGTLAATLNTPCNPGDTLGTAVSQVTVTGG